MRTKKNGCHRCTGVRYTGKFTIDRTCLRWQRKLGQVSLVDLLEHPQHDDAAYPDQHGGQIEVVHVRYRLVPAAHTYTYIHTPKEEAAEGVSATQQPQHNDGAIQAYGGYKQTARIRVCRQCVARFDKSSFRCCVARYDKNSYTLPFGLYGVNGGSARPINGNGPTRVQFQ